MRALAFLAPAALAACTPIELPPPPAPRAIVPSVPDLNAKATAPGAGRVVLDAEPGPAEVSRVISESSVGYGSSFGYRRYRTLQPLEQRQTQLFCITPCVVDLPIGAHKLVFRHQSADGDARSSTAIVAVHGGQPIVVRHAIGDESLSYSAGYFLGWVAATVGVAMTAMGVTVLALGASMKPSGKVNPDDLYTAGAVLGGLGLVLDVTGVLAIVLGRPHHQNGATTVLAF